MNRNFIIIIYYLLLINGTSQSQIKQTLKAFKAIGKTLKNPLIKTVDNTIKKPIFKTIGNSIKNSGSMFRWTKNTIKNFAYGLEGKYLKTKYNFGSKPVKYLGEKWIKKIKYTTPQVFRKSSQFVKTKNKRNFITRSADQLKGKELRSLLNMASKSKPQMTLLFAAGGLERVTQFNLVPRKKKKHVNDVVYTDDDDKIDSKEEVYDFVGKIDRDTEVDLDPHEADHTHTQIWMNGLGKMGSWAAEFFLEDYDPLPHTTRVKFLQAPESSVTMLNHETHYSWYDVRHRSIQRSSYNMFDVKKHSKYIKTVIEEEMAKLGGKSEKIYLGGFCQGAAMAQHVGLGYEKPLGAIIALSGFKFMETKIHENNKNVPVFIAHGTKDEAFPLKEVIRNSYSKEGFLKKDNVHFAEMQDMGHEQRQDVMEEMKHFINQIKPEEDIEEEDVSEDYVVQHLGEKGEEEKVYEKVVNPGDTLELGDEIADSYKILAKLKADGKIPDT